MDSVAMDTTGTFILDIMDIGHGVQIYLGDKLR